MTRLSVISAALFIMTLSQSGHAMRGPAMAHDPKLGQGPFKILDSEIKNKKSHVCPYQTAKVCAGGGLHCNTNPAPTRTAVGQKGDGVL